jgi:hypothetical protein
MRDPTRGGVATSLNELARDCGWGIVLTEESIPLHDAVRGACELLGLDPLHIANEGQFLAVVAPEYADAALNALNLASGGEDAQIIGEVREQPSGAVWSRRDTAAAGSWICWWAIRCRAFVDCETTGFRGGALATVCGLAAQVASQVEARCSAQSDCRRIFLSRGGRLAQPCRSMSERFLAGGRLLAFGRGPYATDAQHVSVEFVHPVIVGKRALPALDISMLFRPWLESILHPKIS